MSQRDLAKALGLANWSFVATIEKGRAPAPEALAKRIANVLEEPALEEALLRARAPIPEHVLVYLLENPDALETLVKLGAS
jgi:transcriptional regulator with XRE-family HTH domain